METAKTISVKALASLIQVDGAEPCGEPQFRELCSRAGFGQSYIDRILDPDKPLAPHAVRLLALQLYLERTHSFDAETSQRILRTGRQLARALRPDEKLETAEFDVPLRLRKGTLRRDPKASIDSAVKQISTMCAEIGVPDMSNTSILDIGCGVKLTQAFFGRKIPVKRYHGVDVDLEMIEFLQENVKDERFSYAHIDVYNAMYHKKAAPLSPETHLGADGQMFDLICLFSVFTHLAPEDSRAICHLARKYIAPNGTLIFTSFINNSISGDFEDNVPDRPLLQAIYRENAVREFTGQARWEIKRIFKFKMQHWVVCKPA